MFEKVCLKFAYLQTETSAVAFQQFNVDQSSVYQTTGFVILPFRRIFSFVFEKIMRSLTVQKSQKQIKIQ